MGKAGHVSRAYEFIKYTKRYRNSRETSRTFDSPHCTLIYLLGVLNRETATVAAMGRHRQERSAVFGFEIRKSASGPPRRSAI